MKPDGVDTATMEPMEALNAGPAIEVAPVDEAQDQALPATQTEGQPQPTEALSASDKTGKEKPADPKSKTKAPSKTKTPTTGTKASTTSSRPTTGQSRLTNGTQKPQANGVTKKTTTGGLEKKSSSTTAASKKTVGSTAAPTTKTPTKVPEKKPIGTARAASAPSNGVKTTGTMQPKKAPAAPANGLKPKQKTTAPAPRPASASTTKPSTTGSPKPDRPPVSKTTRPAGSTPTARSSPATPKPATPTAASKTPTSASRPTTATSKTPSTTAKPSPAKTTAPPAGRTPTTKTTTPVKKDVTKQPSTSAAKKPSASPLTRPASAKTTKPDTPKSATPAKQESASKKLTTSSKVADVKTSRPKETKAASSKEVSASPKTTSTKSSTKTSSPKKAVGSSTPMPVKRGPKATQLADAAATKDEKEDIVPIVAAVAAPVAAAAAAIATMETSEEAAEDSVTPTIPAVCDVKSEEIVTHITAAFEEAPEGTEIPSIPTSDKAPEDIVTPVLPPASDEAPEDTVKCVIPPVSDEAPEDTDTPVIPPVSDEAPDDTDAPVIPPVSDEAPDDTDAPVIPPVSDEAPDDTDAPVIPPVSDEAPDDTDAPVIPPVSDEAPEDTVTPDIPIVSDEAPKDTVTPVMSPASNEAPEDTVTPVISPPYDEAPEETATLVLPPASDEAPKDKDTPVIPPAFNEAPEDTVTSVLPPVYDEAPEDTVTPVMSPVSDEAPEDTVTSVLPPVSDEAPEDTVTPSIPPAFDEAPEDTVRPVLSPASDEAPEDTVTPAIPPAFDEAPEDTVRPVLSPASDEALEDTVTPAIPPAFDEAHKNKVTPFISPAFDEEDTLTPFIPPASEEVDLVYSQDVLQSMDISKDDSAISQLAAEVDLVSLEEPVSTVSPLGTTVLSPPSSPTGPKSMPAELQNSAPFFDMQGPAATWAQSLYPSTTTPDSQEQDQDREQDDIQMSPAADNMMGGFDLLSSTGADHFRSAAPVSPCQEREVAVEKAEEEINEDIDEEEDEEEEREIGIEQEVPQTEMDNDFKKATADFGSSDWGMVPSDDRNSSYTFDTEVTSPFNAENRCSAKETGDIFMNEADRGQPFQGPPGIEYFCDEDDDEEDESKEEEHEKEEQDEEEDENKEEEHDKEEQDDKHNKQTKLEEKDGDVEMVCSSMTESGLGYCGNNGDDDDDGDDYTEEGHLGLDNMGHTVQIPSMTVTEAWGHSNPFSEQWAQPASLLSESCLTDTRSEDSYTPTKFSTNPDTPPKSPAEAFLNMSPPLIKASEPQPDIQEETESTVPVESGILAAPAIGMSQSSTLSGTALAAHSSSETSTPEELRDYDSSSGVESRSDKQRTPVPTMQTDMEQDLGIHLERGDGEEEEAETLPADEVLGDAATAPASVPSSPSSSGDEASDTEGEMQINDPDVAVDERTAVPHNLTALEEDEEAPEQIGEEDGDTPQSANSVASYGFDCSASNSNAHSTAESCGKSPGIFSLENEEQLPEEAKDPSFIKELTLPAASAYSEDLLGCPVDLLPISEPTERDAGFDEHYMLCRKMDPTTMEEVDPESPMHLSPQHGDDSDGQPPYYSAICDKTDNFLAGKPWNSPQLSLSQQENGNHPTIFQEMNDNNYLAPLPNTNRQQSQPQSQPQTAVPSAESYRFPAKAPPRASHAALVPNQQLLRLEQHQLQLRHIRQRQEQERLQRMRLEEERQRQEQQRALERQRRELLQLQLQQQQQEHRLRRQILQRQLEMEQQHRHKQQQQPMKAQPPASLLLSSSSGLCTIYEAMETSEEEDEEEDTENGSRGNKESPRQTFRSVPTDLPLRVANGNLRRPPTQELDWNTKLDMVQQLINQALLLDGEDGCPPLLYLPGQGGGILSPLESSLWPHVISRFDSATVASISSYCPSSQGSSPQGDWTVVELETHH